MRYKKLARSAAKVGTAVLRSGGNALDAVKAAVVGKFLRNLEIEDSRLSIMLKKLLFLL